MPDVQLTTLPHFRRARVAQMRVVRPDDASPRRRAQTITFTVMTFAQMALLLAARSQSQSLFTLGLRSNLPLTGAVLLTLVRQIAAIYLPAVNGIFRTRPLTFAELGLCTAVAVIVFAAIEAEKWLVRRGWISARGTGDGFLKAGAP